MAMRADDPNNFHVVGRAVVWRLRVTNVLTDCVRIGEKLFRHLVIDDWDAWGVFVFRFGLVEIATAQELYPDRVEISWSGGCVKRVCTRIRRLRVGRHRFAASTHPAHILAIAAL